MAKPAYIWDGSAWVELSTAPGQAGANGTNGQDLTSELDLQTISTNTTISDGTYVGKTLYCTNSSTITISVNNDSSTIPVGSQINIIRYGTGAVTVAGSATVNATPGKNLRAQYSMATLIKVVDGATDQWLLVGDISA